ncbi:hypothetical protein F0562_010482 [Nyssa sinensis]|uniref:Uncharacterized protein n=1 Tax=Nyssa sinensis TaxID=561372 RepID=A0A5J5A487_9ASTE|nr:hypothetical protein F0562_010482 [Nyssa sinensis]
MFEGLGIMVRCSVGVMDEMRVGVRVMMVAVRWSGGGVVGSDDGWGDGDDAVRGCVAVGTAMGQMMAGGDGRWWLVGDDEEDAADGRW